MCHTNYDMFVVLLLYGKGLALKILMNNLLWPAILLQVEKQLVDQPLLMFEGRAVCYVGLLYQFVGPLTLLHDVISWG